MTVLSSHRSVAGPGRRAGWTPARIISAVIGVLLALCSLGLLGAGGVASRYLARVGYATVRGITHDHPVYAGHTGGAPPNAPARAGIWTAHTTGPGTQTLTWPDRAGNWTVAAMNADGSHPVAVRVSVAVTLPSLPWIAAGLLVSGVLMLAGGVALGAVPARRAASTAHKPTPDDRSPARRDEHDRSSA